MLNTSYCLLEFAQKAYFGDDLHAFSSLRFHKFIGQRISLFMFLKLFHYHKTFKLMHVCVLFHNAANNSICTVCLMIG